MRPDAAVSVAQLAQPGGSRRLRELGAQEFRQLATLIHDVAGISLNESKRALMVRRLSSHVQSLGLTSFGDYHDLVRADDSGQELVQLLDLIATNETHFFREPAHFDYLEREVFPRWQAEAREGTRQRHVRIWSAACSTGQEPYTLGMLLLANLPASEGWTFELLATDISTQALDAAAHGTWSVDKAKEIPTPYLKRFLRRGTGPQVGVMRAVQELRDAITFRRLNLNEDALDVIGSFDIVFCRNVLIYFTQAGRAQVIEKLTQRLTPDGLLFVGHAESLHEHRTRLRAVLPTVYTRLP
ncbi:MAG: methyltransferase, CheR-type [Gemmatimonadetes bacterium]|nr:methyltransferase, CheR-type [Gemmatimonadota bacterium]